MPLGEHSLAEVVLEPSVSGAQRALRALVALEALDPLDLFLALDLLVEFLTLATFFSQDVVIDLAFRFDRPRDRVHLHLLVVLDGPVDAVHSQ